MACQCFDEALLAHMSYQLVVATLPLRVRRELAG